jgi:hypothetical protein
MRQKLPTSVSRFENFFRGLYPRTPVKKGREDIRRERRGGERKEREGKEGEEGREWCPLASS